MEQHPIPQQISSYQFRLVGDMTLKQFFQLAGGVLVSFLFYATNLHPIIKWPLIILFTSLGAAIAFLPYEDRPLDHWIVAFFRSIYSPTVFRWQKAGDQKFFQEEAVAPPDNFIAPGGKEELKQYLEKRATKHGKSTSKLEAAEVAFLSGVSSLFGKTKKSQAPIKQPPQPSLQQVGPIKPAPQPKLQGVQGKKDIKIPQVEPIRVQKAQPVNGRPVVVVEENGIPVSQVGDEVVAPVRVGKEDPNLLVKDAEFSQDAAPPNPPEKANTITGQVMSSDGKIIEAAILEIKDSANRPVRAVKTNKVGHFIIVTPLQNGEYEIETEKEGFIFELVKFQAKGKIIPPIAIKATGKTNENS